MKGIIVFLLCALLQQDGLHKFKYWENFDGQEKQAVLGDANVPGIIKDLFYTQKPLGDDSETECILEILSEPQTDRGRHAFYFYMFNKLFFKSDGALAEMVAPYCYKLFIADSKYVFAYISRNSDLLDWYACNIGSELAFAELGVSEYLQMDYPTFEKQLLSENADTDCSRFLELVRQYRKSIFE